MDTLSCYRLADRINAGLKLELGQGIERDRMVKDSLYARDVLLVCEALRGSELARLAQEFRTALTAPPPAPAPEPTAAGAGNPAGFKVSRFFNSLFGHPSGMDSGPAAVAPPPPKRNNWFGRGGGVRK